MRKKYIVLVAMMTALAAAAGYRVGAQSDQVHVQRFDAVTTRHGYAILYTFEGKEYSVAFRVRPHAYPAYSVQCWVIEGWDAEYADELLETLDDEIWLTGSEKPLIKQRWNREVR